MPMRLPSSQNNKIPPRHQSTKSSSTTHVMSEQSRKVLEEIKKTKNHLLKQSVAASRGIPYSAPPAPLIPNNHFNVAPLMGGFQDVHLSPAQRSAMQTLQQANATSSGSFVATDSHFGNAILPVLPRLEPLKSVNMTDKTVIPEAKGP